MRGGTTVMELGPGRGIWEQTVPGSPCSPVRPDEKDKGRQHFGVRYGLASHITYSEADKKVIQGIEGMFSQGSDSAQPSDLA